MEEKAVSSQKWPFVSNLGGDPQLRELGRQILGSGGQVLGLGEIDVVSGDTCPQGTSNARHVAALAGLKASRTNYPTSNENHKTASDQISAAFI
jgi:hypothetical protein